MRNPSARARRTLPIKALTCMMFFTFAMTTDAVGSVIPQLMREFDLSLTAAGAFHYVPMIAIAAGGLRSGFLADRPAASHDHRGLVAYGVSSLLAFGSGSRSSCCCSRSPASA
jgi:MFS transporter, DHA1 family, quinolone resistance protein